MIESIFILVAIACAAFGGYQLGLMDGEKREFRKWYGRQWHRPGCSCDDINEVKR